MLYYNKYAYFCHIILISIADYRYPTHSRVVLWTKTRPGDRSFTVPGHGYVTRFRLHGMQLINN